MKMSVGGETNSVATLSPHHHTSGGGGGPTPQSTADYLAQLLKDKKQLAAFPNVFLHMERLLDDGRCIFLALFICIFKKGNCVFYYSFPFKILLIQGLCIKKFTFLL